MKNLTITIVLSVLFMYALRSQEIILDHLAPKIEIFRTVGTPSIEFGYFGQAGNELNLYSFSGIRTVKLNAGDAQDNNGSLTLYNQAGQSTIKLVGGYGQTINGRIITSELEITGGSDLAEHFDLRSTDIVLIKPGFLVSIDEENEGKLRITKSKRDRKIVGVLSGANGVGTGLIMRQAESIADGAFPIALVGRAYVYVTNENGSIQSGDFLTSSSKPGYAMKVKSVKRSMGAIIGKAMTSMNQQKGYVLVLINLQ